MSTSARRGPPQQIRRRHVLHSVHAREAGPPATGKSLVRRQTLQTLLRALALAATLLIVSRAL